MYYVCKYFFKKSKIMKLKLFLLITILFCCYKAHSQSDDGWFTGKIAAAYSTEKKFQTSYDFLYNLENHLSFGTGLAFVVDNFALLDTRADIRIRPFGHKNFMPAIWLKYGYRSALSHNDKGSAIFSPEICLETGFHTRIKFTVNLSAEFYKINGEKFQAYTIGCGILM